MDAMTYIGPTRTAPRWCARFLGPENLHRAPAKVDASQFNAQDAVVVDLSAGASAGAVSISFVALDGPIPAGSLIDFGTTKLAITTAAAPAGATSVAVRALPTALLTTDMGTYRGVGTVAIPSGTYLGRTFAERDAGTGYGPAADTDDERFLSAWPITNARTNPDVELVRHGVEIRTNFLPEYDTLASAVKAKLITDYVPITGAE